MSSLTFVPSATAPARAIVSSSPWLCGRPVTARVPVYRRSLLRACTPLEASSDDAVPNSDPEPIVETAPEPVAVVETEPVLETVAEGESAVPPVAVHSVAMPETAVESASEQGDDKSEAVVAEGEGDRKRRRRTRPKHEITLKLEDMTIGMELEGTVKSVMDYGAFIGGMGTASDGLLHVSQLAAGFVEKVSDVVKTGQQVKVRVLYVDLDRGNFSLTMKTAEELAAPRQERRSGGDRSNKKEGMNKKWDDFTFDPHVFVEAKVTSITDFGAFAKLLAENGEMLPAAPTEGLIHISELSNDRVESVASVLKMDQLIKVRITATDRKRNRISLSMKEFREAAAGGGYDEGRGDFTADIAELASNQPEFRSTMEIAFETAKAAAAAKEA